MVHQFNNMGVPVPQPWMGGGTFKPLCPYNQRRVEVPLNLSSLTFDMIQYNAMDRHAASIVHFNNTMQIKYMAKSYSELSV